MSIDILSLCKFKANSRAINIALPVLALECEATPLLENNLDAYEETVLKLISIGLRPRSIAGELNATESLIGVILDNLNQKKYVERAEEKAWGLTEDGEKYLNGNIGDRKSDNSVFGYLFINAIKKEVLPYFYSGDIRQIPLFYGEELPAKLTVGGDENKTFEHFAIKRSKLGEAYRRSFKNSDYLQKFDDGSITFDEAVDRFENLDFFDEEDGPETLEDVVVSETKSADRNMFIRPLRGAPKHVYLTMRVVINPNCPDGYSVESPFDYGDIDNRYFLRQMQWLLAKGNIFIGDEELSYFLTKEIRKLSPSFKESEKDFSVFVLEKMPLLKIFRNQFPTAYDDMAKIYSLMQRQGSTIEKENIVNTIYRSVVECLFNAFFKGIKKETLEGVSKKALADLNYYGSKYYISILTKGTTLLPDKITWGHRYAATAIGRMNTTRGNSIVEKFINVIVLNYYLGTAESKRLLTNKDAQRIYELADSLNRIRRIVVHDTEERFENSHYEFFVTNVFDLINGLLEAYKEN